MNADDRVAPSVDFAALSASGQSLSEQGLTPRDVVELLNAARDPGLPAPCATPLPQPDAAGARRTVRVCIATSDLRGPVRNGGVGTACSMLAEALADAGHDVWIVYVGPFEAGTADTWRRFYADRRPTFVVPEASPVRLEGAPHARTSYAVYQWLTHQPPFDVVHFPEINGVGFYTLQAKRLGLAFETTHFCVSLHSPTFWHRLENREPISHTDDLVLDFIERESVRWADTLVSPTHYLLGWAARWGFTLPQATHVHPYIVPQAGNAPRRPDAHEIKELVFFGRLETRKGLELFCDALELLAKRDALQGVNVTFLGKSGRVRTEDGAAYARRRTRTLNTTVRFETALDQSEAVSYLRDRAVLAVMPSLSDNMPYAVLECLAEGIPFVSCRTGGIPEMVAQSDHARTLAAPEPSSLADVITTALRDGALAARSAVDDARVRTAWVAWHERVAPTHHTPRKRSTDQPLVSVCIATRNRGATLREAIRSIERQTYRHLEVVLVDDASDQEESTQLLEALEADFAPRGWSVIRRTDRGLPGAARNTAAAHAHGKYLLFMDDDNLARPNEIETFAGAAEYANTEVLTCFLDHFLETTNGSPVTLLRWLPLGAATAPGFVNNEFGDTNMFIRRDTFFRLGGFDEDRDAAFVEDWVFLSRASLAGVRMAVLPESLFWYRVWEQGHSQRDANISTATRRLYPYLRGETPDRRALLTFTSGLQQRMVAMRLADHVRTVHEQQLAARFEKAEPFISIDGRDNRSIAAQQELDISLIEGGILFRSHGYDPIAWLPRCPPSHAHSIVRIEMSSPQDGCLQLFWSTNRVPYPTEEQSIIIPFPAGRAILWGEIPAAAHVGRLRLDPAFSPGDYVFHHVEIRSEETSKDGQALWAELQALHASRSWRWTAGARAILDKFRRRAQASTTQSPPPPQD